MANWFEKENSESEIIKIYFRREIDVFRAGLIGEKIKAKNQKLETKINQLWPTFY